MKAPRSLPPPPDRGTPRPCPVPLSLEGSSAAEEAEIDALAAREARAWCDEARFPPRGSDPEHRDTPPALSDEDFKAQTAAIFAKLDP